MIKLFYALQPDMLSKYADTKTELINARNNTPANEIEAYKQEIVKNCQVYDIDNNSDDMPYTVNNGVAEINIAGMLVQKVDICAAFFGETVTTYGYIQECTQLADMDDDVKSIVYHINSGGGVVNGVEETFQIISGTDKPTTAVVHDMAASAAYWLASACDEIISVSKTGFFGSIGVAVEIVNRDKADEKEGYTRTVLTNTTSADKRPDLMTEDGQEVLRAELNAIYKVFTESILSKRSNKLSQKKLDNLKGKVIISDDAIKYGLADKYMTGAESQNYIMGNTAITAEVNNTPEAVQAGETMEETMDFKEFLESNPDAKAAYQNEIEAAKKKGMEQAAAENAVRIAKVAPIMNSDVYDSAVKTQAQKYLEGKLSLEAFEAVISMEDMRIERENAGAAADETPEDTQADHKPENVVDTANLETEADAMARLNKMIGKGA